MSVWLFWCSLALIAYTYAGYAVLVALMARLRGTVLYSAAAYGIAALAIELGFAVIERRSALIARPIWALLTFVVAAATAGVSWWMLSARRR